MARRAGGRGERKERKGRERGMAEGDENPWPLSGDAPDNGTIIYTGMRRVEEESGPRNYFWTLMGVYKTRAWASSTDETGNLTEVVVGEEEEDGEGEGREGWPGEEDDEDGDEGREERGEGSVEEVVVVERGEGEREEEGEAAETAEEKEERGTGEDGEAVEGEEENGSDGGDGDEDLALRVVASEEGEGEGEGDGRPPAV